MCLMTRSWKSLGLALALAMASLSWATATATAAEKVELKFKLKAKLPSGSTLTLDKDGLSQEQSPQGKTRLLKPSVSLDGRFKVLAEKCFEFAKPVPQMPLLTWGVKACLGLDSDVTATISGGPFVRLLKSGELYANLTATFRHASSQALEALPFEVSIVPVPADQRNTDDRLLNLVRPAAKPVPPLAAVPAPPARQRAEPVQGDAAPRKRFGYDESLAKKPSPQQRLLEAARTPAPTRNRLPSNLATGSTPSARQRIPAASAPRPQSVRRPSAPAVARAPRIINPYAPPVPSYRRYGGDAPLSGPEGQRIRIVPVPYLDLSSSAPSIASAPSNSSYGPPPGGAPTGLTRFGYDDNAPKGGYPPVQPRDPKGVQMRLGIEGGAVQEVQAPDALLEMLSDPS